MNENQIIGNPETMKALTSVLQSGKVGHAYLFVGPAGVGKKTIARFLIKRMLCLKTEESGECDCEACRRLRQGSHPDLITVSPLTGNSIKIEQLREMQHQAYLSPILGRYKIFFFPEAEQLTEAAGNSFLKILEEAPPGVIYIFTAVRSDLILGTIRSRCQVYTLFPVPESEVAAGLVTRGYSEAEARQRAAASKGLPGMALQPPTETPADFPEFEAVLQQDLLNLLKLANDLEKEERLRIVRLLQQWQIEARQGLAPLRRGIITSDGSLKTRIGLIEKLAEMTAMVEQNVSIRLVLEDFFITAKLDS